MSWIIICDSTRIILSISIFPGDVTKARNLASNLLIAVEKKETVGSQTTGAMSQRFRAVHLHPFDWHFRDLIQQLHAFSGVPRVLINICKSPWLPRIDSDRKGQIIITNGKKKGEIKFCSTTREIPLSTGTVFREGGLHINFDLLALHLRWGPRPVKCKVPALEWILSVLWLRVLVLVPLRLRGVLLFTVSVRVPLISWFQFIWH